MKASLARSLSRARSRSKLPTRTAPIDCKNRRSVGSYRKDGTASASRTSGSYKEEKLTKLNHFWVLETMIMRAGEPSTSKIGTQYVSEVFSGRIENAEKAP